MVKYTSAKQSSIERGTIRMNFHSEGGREFETTLIVIGFIFGNLPWGHPGFKPLFE
jgi:hypothetical protein